MTWAISLCRPLSRKRRQEVKASHITAKWGSAPCTHAHTTKLNRQMERTGVGGEDEAGELSSRRGGGEGVGRTFDLGG